MRYQEIVETTRGAEQHCIDAQMKQVDAQVLAAKQPSKRQEKWSYD
jgi:hypothetical protein